jgi:hypothetical protein
MTALLFSIPRQRRPLSAMRAAVVRRLDQLNDWRTQAEGDAFDRLEKLLACIENKLAPHLAARRNALAAAAEQRRQEARAERDREAHRAQVERERERSRLEAAIDADPRVIAALDAHDLLWAKEQTTDAAECRIETWLNDPAVSWDEKDTSRLTAARSANTRAHNKASKAFSELAAIRDRVRREQERH